MKILITGAAGGIGYLTALTLAENKENTVYLTCHNKNQVKNVSKKVKDYKNIIVMKIDITNEEDRKKVLDLNIDVLYNNAAICQGGSIIEADMDKVRENYEVNVFSSFELLKEVLKQMIEKDSGKIVVASSIAGIIPLPFVGIYGSTKSSISTITKSLQKELSLITDNVKVILVEPGLYHTGFNDIFLDNKYDNGKYFKDIKNEIYDLEHAILKLGEKKELDSIVVQIVRAITDKKTKKVYRAPLTQVIFAKIYSLFK